MDKPRTTSLERWKLRTGDYPRAARRGAHHVVILNRRSRSLHHRARSQAWTRPQIKGTCQVIFEVGETVVYPHHGAATITAVKSRKIKGEDTKYITLNVHQSELTIDLPIENAELVGLRDVIDLEGVEAVYDVLRGEVEEETGNWSRRFKANTEKMGSGNVLRIAEVVRDLWRREQGAGVSAGEKRMLFKARQILVSELALALKLDDDGATEALDAVLVTTIPASDSAEAAA